MKTFLSIVLFASLVFSSCEDPCTNSLQAGCTDSPPTNELCQAYFERWFYTATTNQCALVGYSGCSQRGFATKADCEACQCN